MRRRRRHWSWRRVRLVGLGLVVAVLALEIVYRLVALPPDYHPTRHEAALPAVEAPVAPEATPGTATEPTKDGTAPQPAAPPDEREVALAPPAAPPAALPGLRLERRIERSTPRRPTVLGGAPAPGPAAGPAPEDESGLVLAIRPRPPLPPEAGPPPVATVVPPAIPRRPAPPPRDDGGTPLVAIVIDDMGYSPTAFTRLAAMPGPLTLAFLPYAQGTAGMLAPAGARGFELLLHLPMEPLGDANPGPEALLVGLDEAELRRRVRWAIDRVPGVVGVNNHMGSRFTADPRGLGIVMEELHARRLFFLDSRTNPASLAERVALAAGIPATGRDIFIDHDPTAAFIARQLALIERSARVNGDVIAIGHPYPATLAALEAWLPTLADRGLRLARLSEVLARRLCARAVSGGEPCGPALHLIGHAADASAAEPAAGPAPPR